MDLKVFDLKVFGKCIVSGEHSVIRGSPAIVVPVKSKYLEISYANSDQEFETQFIGDMKEDLSLVFWGTLEKALKILNRKHSEMRGEVKLDNRVPIGAGMGASATLCVGIGRLMENWGWIEEKNLYEFCRQLENLFHGESSGVDIAATLMGRPIEFQRPGLITELKINWKPQLFLSHCGQRGMTSECVRIVKELWKTNEIEARKIDDDMMESVRMARQALLSNENMGLVDLIQSLNKARSCFERWGLTVGPLDSHMKKLTEFGALAVKPTGSGRGGYVLSLWKNQPPAEISSDLLPLNL